MRKIALEMVVQNGVLCLICQSYDLILIDRPIGAFCTGRNSLFPARGVRGQALAFYKDWISIVKSIT